MAVASNLVDISLCESLTNWSNSGGPVLSLKDLAGDGLPPVEGTYSLGADVDIETGIFLYDIYTANGNVALDMSNKHFFAWVQSITAGFLDSYANGGIQFVMEDGAGNQGYWYVAGNDTYTGGWARFVIDGNSTPTANNGTNPTATNIYQIGIIAKATAKSKLTENFLIDLLQYGLSASAAITVTGGTSGTPLTWEDILSGDICLAKPAGVIRKVGGVYYLQGPIAFGDATTDVYFKDTGKIVVWEDTLASLSYYDLTLNGNGLSEFNLGDVTGSGNDRFGSGGGTITSAGLHAWTFDAETNVANIAECNWYGVNANKSGVIQFDNIKEEVISTTFDACGNVQYNEAVVLNCNFLNSTDSLGSVEMLDNGDDNLTYCFFRNNLNSIYFPSGQTATRDFVGLDVGGTNHVNNASGSAVTVNLTLGSIASTYTGSLVTFLSSATLTIKGLQLNTEIRIYRTSDGGTLAGTEAVTTSDGEGFYKFDYAYTTTEAIYIKIMHLEYEYQKISYSLPGSDSSIPVQQRVDRNYNNP